MSKPDDDANSSDEIMREDEDFEELSSDKKNIPLKKRLRILNTSD